MANQLKSTNTSSKNIIRMIGVPLSGATGRRKKAVARVWARRGNGKIVVNGKNYEQYFDTPAMRLGVARPLVVCEAAKNYDFQVNVFGGGKHGQSDAIKLGIARVLVALDSNLRSVLRQERLLTVDSRTKERKKYGQRGARRKFQFVKR